ncbi:hypothetical protein QFC22_006340 [Naganishia vaughanmartiniae]|uniref:Uncharacterized protein n=1 Tax=Naganishia vaughanmartiniae TaxID=1424756 RepID=A0ACC2WN86_9TREE|nr:hypothetical protein QFC22_006340 [Naganishia vaughanmartiniae]
MPPRLADSLINATSDASPAPPAYQLAPPIIPNELSGSNRPALPFRARNLFLDQGYALVVKFQTIVRDGKEIIVGRLKVPTYLTGPLEHAFILRRYDTGAISVTTMFKAAFPSATAEDEEREMKWIKSAPLSLAKHLGPAYKLEPWIEAMCAARPETGVAYRKSQRSQRAAEEASQRTVPAANAPAVPVNTRTTHPAAVPPVQQQSPQSVRQPLTGSRQTPSRTGVMRAPRELDNGELLHISRNDEFAPDSTFQDHHEQLQEAPTPTPPSTQRSTGTPGRAAKRSRPAPSEIHPASIDVDAMDTTTSSAPDHVTVTLQSTHELHAPLSTSATALTAAAEAEIAASKADVLRLREEALARSAAGESASEMGLVADNISGGPGSSLSATGGLRGVKRTTEDVEVEDDFLMIPGGASGQPAGAVTALANSGAGRVIAGNRRIVNPEVAIRRQGIWGGALFAAGMAATYLASNFLL